MAFNFKVDGKKAQTFGALPAGEYELFITGAKAIYSSKGTPGVSMVLTVRNDVDQVGGGRKVWHTLWVNENTHGIVQAFMKAIEVPDGTEFNSLEEIANYVKGRPVRAKLDIQEDNSNFNEVKSFSISHVGGFYEEEEAGGNADANDGPLDISEDDMPF